MANHCKWPFLHMYLPTNFIVCEGCSLCFCGTALERCMTTLHRFSFYAFARFFCTIRCQSPLPLLENTGSKVSSE